MGDGESTQNWVFFKGFFGLVTGALEEEKRVKKSKKGALHTL